jgi:hypothetical protein
MIDYSPAWRARSAEGALFTVLGTLMVGLGTLASATPWLAISGAVVVGFLAELAPLAGGRMALLRTALLLSFMLAVAVPATALAVLPNLAGWLLAGIVAQGALLVIWIPLQPIATAGADGSPHRSSADPIKLVDYSSCLGKALGTGMAMGLAVLLTRVLKVDHAFWVVLGVLPVLSARDTLATRTFLQEQSGTLVGFLVGALLVALLGTHQVWYWVSLPLIIFASIYAATALGLVAGQAAFTVFAIMLFCILLPEEKHVGIVRVQNIALGGTVSLLVAWIMHASGQQ